MTISSGDIVAKFSAARGMFTDLNDRSSSLRKLVSRALGSLPA